MTWRTVGGYAAGTSHLESNVPCQDRCATALLGEGSVVVAVVADGAGSAACAERGAELVCAALLDAIAADIASDADVAAVDDDAVRAWLAAVRERIGADAAANGHELRDYAATALAAVAGETHAICVQLGDGGIVVRTAGETFTVAVWPEGGEYANQTFFISDGDALERVVIARFGRVDDVVLFSDGLLRLALDHTERTAFAPFFEPLTRTVRAATAPLADVTAELVAYLGSAAINARTDDDKALTIATRMR